MPASVKTIRRDAKAWPGDCALRENAFDPRAESSGQETHPVLKLAGSRGARPDVVRDQGGLGAGSGQSYQTCLSWITVVSRVRVVPPNPPQLAQ